MSILNFFRSLNPFQQKKIPLPSDLPEDIQNKIMFSIKNPVECMIFSIAKEAEKNVNFLKNTYYNQDGVASLDISYKLIQDFKEQVLIMHPTCSSDDKKLSYYIFESLELLALCISPVEKFSFFEWKNNVSKSAEDTILQLEKSYSSSKIKVRPFNLHFNQVADSDIRILQHFANENIALSTVIKRAMVTYIKLAKTYQRQYIGDPYCNLMFENNSALKVFVYASEESEYKSLELESLAEETFARDFEYNTRLALSHYPPI